MSSDRTCARSRCWGVLQLADCMGRTRVPFFRRLRLVRCVRHGMTIRDGFRHAQSAPKRFVIPIVGTLRKVSCPHGATFVHCHTDLVSAGHAVIVTKLDDPLVAQKLNRIMISESGQRGDSTSDPPGRCAEEAGTHRQTLYSPNTAHADTAAHPRSPAPQYQRPALLRRYEPHGPGRPGTLPTAKQY